MASVIETNDLKKSYGKHEAVKGLNLAVQDGSIGAFLESATGTALFTLGLPVRRSHLFVVRAAMAWAQAIVLGIGAALLIPVVSHFAGEQYPLGQALEFGALMSCAGLVILAFGLLLSEVFEAEFTTPAIGFCAITTFFFSYKAHILHGWNLFDTMSAAASIDPNTQLMQGPLPWAGLGMSLSIALLLLRCAAFVMRRRDI